MATIVTVHGTYAHSAGLLPAVAQPDHSGAQWWQEGSAFDRKLRALVACDGGEVALKPFVWSGDNSELSRRSAGSALLRELRVLEARGEPYCVVGHSHGGSVISSALIESVSRGKPLQHLKRWITVGTPFVGLRRERFLFSRLGPLPRVMFVASLMLLMMFIFYVVGELLDNRQRGESYYYRLLFTAAMMSAPFLLLYTFFKIRDSRSLFFYRRSAIRKADALYASKWLSLCHENDEAVQGLRYLPRLRLQLFDRSFAVPVFTTLAVVALPITYYVLVSSPRTMMAIADLLRTKVYDVQKHEAYEQQIRVNRDRMRQYQQEIGQARARAAIPGEDGANARAAQQQIESVQAKIRNVRRETEQSVPEVRNAERALRFKRRFLMEGDKPCKDGRLCGEGRRFSTNSALLYHVVTDELAHAVVGDDWSRGRLMWFARLMIPIVLVPVIFGILAALILMFVRAVAHVFSAAGSAYLNKLTHAEIQRSALGNDTEGEIALGADNRPFWISTSYPYLPADLAACVTTRSNEATSRSLAKFRSAISTLALAADTDATAAASQTGWMASYLTWEELIHTSYFSVPEFASLVAASIAATDGFKPRSEFAATREFATATGWLDQIRPRPAAA